MESIILGVVADTHVPDRAAGLNPRLVESFREQEVAAILHAGDICIPAVLEELGKIAPVHAVRGNRDFFYLRSLPERLILEFNGIGIGLVHGHGFLRDYLIDRLRYYLGGLSHLHYRQRALRTFPGCRVIVFGHIHFPVHHWIDEQYLFNPGSACCPDQSPGPASAGLLHLHADGSVEGKVFFLS